jgi:hypothetical protein
MQLAEPQLKGFNLFRVNCLLNDAKSSNFNSIIVSIINEYFYENHNEQRKLKDIYRYIREYLKIVIEFDFLAQLIAKSGNFQIDPIQDDSLINLTAEKFANVEQTISLNSIDKHITSFLNSTGTDVKYKEAIEALLYAAVFENINSFSVDNLKSLLPDIQSEELSKEEIDVYNEFLDFPGEEKNKAIYNILSRAVEFAILTSGKGIKEISKEIFKDKSFILDTNIIFRLLGVGGEERSDSVINLLHKCKSLGMNFIYTGKTHLELNNKLDQIINFLNSKNVLPNIDVLGEISDAHPEMFNDDFIVHYSILKHRGIVHTPEQYQRKLQKEYQKLMQQFNAKVLGDDNIDEREIGRLSKFLFAKKKEMRIYYGKKASEVDAYNILLVRKKRGANNHNLSDVKSFYLTSDRSLNFILSRENSAKIPETIFPSQLFILCKPYFDTDSVNDYDDFIKFIKKRKTGFKYAGSQVLNYINSIRELTTEVEVISESLIMYSDIRFRNTKENMYSSEATIPNYKTVLKTLLDKKLFRGEETEQVFQSLIQQTDRFANSRFNASKNIVRVIDILATILIIPLGLYSSKLVTQNISIQVAAIIVLESIKFYLTSRFNFFNHLHLYFFRIFTNKKRANLIPIHAELVDVIDKKSLETKNNIWKFF